jgi:hypothetical protein
MLTLGFFIACLGSFFAKSPRDILTVGGAWIQLNLTAEQSSATETIDAARYSRTSVFLRSQGDASSTRPAVVTIYASRDDGKYPVIQRIEVPTSIVVRWQIPLSYSRLHFELQRDADQPPPPIELQIYLEPMQTATLTGAAQQESALPETEPVK